MGRIYTSPAASHLTSSSQLTGHFTPHGMLHTSLDTSHLTCWFTTHSRFTPHGLHLHLMGSSHSLMGRFTPHGPLHTSWAASHLTCWFTARDHQLHSRPHGLRSWPRQPRGLWGGGGAGGSPQNNGERLHWPKGFRAQHWGAVVGCGLAPGL